MATIVHEPPKIEERGERSRGSDGFNNGGGRIWFRQMVFCRR